MICPKKKTSKSRRDKRRAQTWKIPIANLATCGKCGDLVRTHRVCKTCGSYNRRDVLPIAE